MKLIQNWAQIISPCSQGMARCHVTRQHCSVAVAQKLSAKQTSSFPVIIAWGWGDLSSQTGRELASCRFMNTVWSGLCWA